jgi:DNA-binding LacI/PurR family transcriptional regulator
MTRRPKHTAYSRGTVSKPATVRERVAAYRKRMRAKGYKPVEVWVPDTSNPKFIARVRRQLRALARIERKDKELMAWLDANTADLVRLIEEEERAAGVPPPSWDPAAVKPI